MQTPLQAFSAAADKFSDRYQSDWEDEAHAQRGEFLRRFPLDSLPRLSLKRYAIGQNGRETFCFWLEQGTGAWAIILGSPATKFGIYHQKQKGNPDATFRYTKKFSDGRPLRGHEKEAFGNVRRALVELVNAGAARDFPAIDGNPLSQMVKAKTLSLYYPEVYLPICSGDMLLDLADALELGDLPLSEIQHTALALKQEFDHAKGWSNLKYTAFLWEEVLGGDSLFEPTTQSTPTDRVPARPPVVDFDALMAKWRAKGKQSEAFALARERARLQSMGYPELADRILDCTDRPRYGYDFQSFSKPGQPRYIEVKTFTLTNNNQSRFFLSANERAKAEDPEMQDDYYFYLVCYGADGEPIDCQMRQARHVLRNAELVPQTYLVRLNR